MEEIKQIVFAACSALIVGEIIYYITPKDKIVNCIYALIYTWVIITSVLAATRVDFNMNFEYTENPYKEEVDEIVSELYLVETTKELEKIIKEALNTVHIPCSGIEPVLRINKENQVELVSMQVKLTYKSDVSNGEIIIKRLLGDTAKLEVTGEK